jgi:hypothetical protein
MSTAGSKRARRFHEILDEEYNLAPAPPAERPRSRRPWLLLTGSAAGVLALTPVVRRAFTRHRSPGRGGRRGRFG